MYAGLQTLRSTDHCLGHHVGLYGAVFGEQAARQPVKDAANSARQLFPKTVFVALAEQYGGLKNMQSPIAKRPNGGFELL
jgi:hypothetical protein